MEIILISNQKIAEILRVEKELITFRRTLDCIEC